MSLTIGSLFSGIAGLELGLEKSGLGKVSWQCEIDEHCRKVLKKHWPEVPCYEDVHDINRETVPYADVICGGFPCQDISTANVKDRAGLAGAKSGLWYEYSRIVGELKPKIVIVENAGRNDKAWVPTVRSDLYGHGYSSVSLRLSTVAIGAPHHRDRVFVVAYTHEKSEPLRTLHEEVARVRENARHLKSHWRNPFRGPVRMDVRIPRGVERVGAVGNAVSPKISELLGLAIKANYV